MISVLGSINMDLVALSERLPSHGETVRGRSFATFAGGKGANQALAAGLSGSSVRMIGAVGEDSFADDSLAMLRVSNIDLSSVKTVPHPTGVAMVLVDDTGENMISIVPGANDAVDPEAAALALEGMSANDFLMLQLEIPAETVEFALKAARVNGVTTVLNTAPFTSDARRLAAMADIIILNETEFDLLVGTGPLSAPERLEELRKLHENGGQTIIVTLGKDGGVAMHHGEMFRTESIDIQPVDTVGAGDTFCGYLVSGISLGLDFAAAMSRAAVAGSITCLSKGAQASIPKAGVALYRGIVL